MTLALGTYSTIKNSSWIGAQSGSVASNTFSPAAGDLIVVLVQANLSYQAAWATPTLTDSLGSHLTWTLRATQTDATASIATWVFTAPCPSAQTNMTVTPTIGTTDNSQYVTDITVQAFTFSGADSSSVGTIVKAMTSTQNPAISLTPTTTGSAVILAAVKFVASTTTPTAGTSTYLRGSVAFGSSASGNGWYGTSGGPTLTAGSAVTLNINSAQASPTWQYIAIEILPASGGGGTDAPADVAAATGTAYDSSPSVAASAPTATATGAAPDPTPAIAPSAAVATGTGTGYDAGPSVTANAATATGVGTAYDATVSITVNAELAAAIGTAYDASTSSSSQTNAPAQTATGTGTAPDPSVSVGAPAQTATGVGTAYDATVSISPNAALATATGTAYDPTPALGATPATATAAGAAYAPTTAVDAPAEPAYGTGVAYDAATAPEHGYHDTAVTIRTRPDRWRVRTRPDRWTVRTRRSP